MNNEQTRRDDEQKSETVGERDRDRATTEASMQDTSKRNQQHSSQLHNYSADQNNRIGQGYSSGGSSKAMQGTSSPWMPGLLATLIGAGAGLGAAYLLGRKKGLNSSRLPRSVRVTATDLSNRARGTWAEATRLFSSDEASDQVLEARIRSKMGRVISHPHSVHVTANNGRIRLEGVIFAHELPALLSAVESVRGVNSIENRISGHDRPSDINKLQGSRTSRGQQRELQQNWSSKARIGAGAIGLGLGAVGATLLVRSFTSSGSGSSSITVDKTINVDAPVDVLFGLWSNFENFPQFMSNVLEVRNIDGKRSHWKVAGPAGIPVEWDAITTGVVPNELIAWRSIEGSTVENAGYVLFEPNDDGTTEVNVRLAYNPPAGAIGHAIAKAFGADPKSEMDEDLMRMKSLLETGRAPHDAAQTPTSHAKSNRVH